MEEKKLPDTVSAERAGRNPRRLYFRVLKKIMKVRYKEPTFIYLGEEPERGGLILSNHEGTDAPLSLEIYLDKPLRMWGAWEMNTSLRTLYQYQTNVYYHEKKHWNIHLARLFCLLASPLTRMFYKGFDLISTYRDARFVKTLRESVRAIEKGDNIVVYPEDSSEGYMAELKDFHLGFVSLAETCARRGIDLPIFVAYFRKSDCTYIFDRPVRFSEMQASGATREEIAKSLCERCNELGKMKLGDGDTEERHAEPACKN